MQRLSPLDPRRRPQDLRTERFDSAGNWFWKYMRFESGEILKVEHIRRSCFKAKKQAGGRGVRLPVGADIGTACCHITRVSPLSV